MRNHNRTRFYVVLLGVLLLFCEISDCTTCEFCGVDFVHLGKHVWRCKQRIEPVNHPTVDDPMRPPDTSTSLINDQYNGNHAHSIINEERPLNVNSGARSKFWGGVAGSEDFACATLPTTPLDFQGKL